MRGKLLLSFFLSVCLSISAWAQERTISGKVTSSDDGTPLPGVSVQIKGSTRGTTTDSDGSFRLAVPDNARLVFSFIGYDAQEVAVGNRSTLAVTLKNGATDLGEVIVVGYGTQQKREVTGAIASVSAKQLENLPIASIEQGIQGRAAGVQITQNSGTPGGGIAVRVRGATSITASNEPLYVVDGIPINTGNYSGIGVGNQQLNALSNLNPTDIESIEILKDAAAAAIYGSRASNGVVLITTKRGKSGSTQVDINTYVGQQQAYRLFTPLTGQQFTQLLNEQVQNRFPRNAAGQISALGATWPTYGDLAAALYSGESDNTNGFRDPAQFNDPSRVTTSTNWYDEVFRRAAISQHDISVRGGNEKTKFFVSGSRFDQPGIIKGSGFERTSFRVNLDHRISSKFNIGTSIGLSRAINTRIQNDNNINGVLSTAVLLATDVPVRNLDGSFGRDPASSVENPLAAATQPTLTGVDLRFLGTAFADWFITKDLTFRTSWSGDFINLREDQFLPTTTNSGRGTNGSGTARVASELNWLTENTLSYRKTFANAHTVSALLGASWQESVFESVAAVATNFPGNSIRRLSAGSVKSDATSGGTSWGFESYFSRFNYDYKGKYQLQVSARYDGSSRFGRDNRFGFFPAVSAGWRIIEESFLKNQDVLSDLRIRGGWGQTGNSGLNDFQSLGLFGGGFNYIQLAGIAPSQIANPDLRWEVTNQANVGLEIGLLNRFNITAEYYVKRTNDLILNRPIPSTSGFTVYSQNVGQMENRGWEFALSSRNVNSGGFEWNTDFNITFNRNKVLKLAEGVPPFAAGFASWVAEGEPLGTFRGFRVDGIFQTQEEINQLDAAAQSRYGAAARYQTALTRPGDVKFRDLNNDGRINNDDQELLGTAQPTFFGGLTNTFRFKGFDLMVFYQFVNGNLIYNNTRAFSEGMNGVFGQTDGVLRRWTPENTNTDVPRAVHGDPNNNRRVSDRWLEDGSFGRIKNVVFGYSLPKSLTTKLRMRSLRAYVQGQNLLTFTKYTGLDPEINTFSGSNTALGTDFLTFPQARVISVGLNLGF